MNINKWRSHIPARWWQGWTEVKNFVRPRRIVVITFADFTPWTETYGPFRTKRGQERFVRMLDDKGYQMLAVWHDFLMPRRGFKSIPQEAIDARDGDAYPEPRIPNQRKGEQS